MAHKNSKTNTNDAKIQDNDLSKIYAIHTASESLKQEFKQITHHYCDVFTENTLPPLPDKVYLKGNEYTVSKTQRVLIVSYDGILNLWQNAPSFKSDIQYASGTTILDSAGRIVSIVTGSKDGYYAISCFDGLSGKFETSHDWLRVDGMSGIIYGNKTYNTRDDLKNYLRGRKLGNSVDLQAVLAIAPFPRIILFDLISGLEVSHTYVRGEFEVKVCDHYHAGGSNGE